MNNRPIILASQSPRRSQLLREAGFQFTVQALDIDESFPEEMPVEEVAPWLAQKKARAAAGLIRDREIVLAADSVVILDDVIYNKPVDRADAIRMLRRMSGRRHTVITGVCLLAKEQEKSFSGVTKVWFADLSDTEIEYYIDTCKPFDKAGSYGVQEWIGHCKITRIEGTFPNVMGLPVDLVYDALQSFR
ncbi:MAG: septum formation protein Maf [Lewinellaceae bacterium]|nr:septum formation protein Maf [Lewinellaceae bacterium]